MDKLGPDVLGMLIDRHAAALELFALQWTESAADIVQTVFVKLAGVPQVPEQIEQMPVIQVIALHEARAV